MKSVRTKTPRKVTVKSAVATPKRKPAKLSKLDPDYFSKIGQLSAKSRKMTSEQMSDLAKQSHPRAEYRGGRKKKNDGSKVA
jgi:hypothetical protein